MDLIDRSEVQYKMLEILPQADSFEWYEQAKPDEVKELVDELYSIVLNVNQIDAQPVKRGKWIDVDYKTLGHGFLETYPNDGVCCSECRTGFKKSRLLIRSYCPNCGSYNGD